MAQNLLTDGFAGDVFFVNPKYANISGHPCYPTVESLPVAPTAPMARWMYLTRMKRG